MGNEKSKPSNKASSASRKNTGAEPYKNQESSKTETNSSHKSKPKSDATDKPASENKPATPTTKSSNNKPASTQKEESSDSSDFDADAAPKPTPVSSAEKPKKDVPVPSRSKSEDPEYTDTIPLEIDPEDIHFGEFIGEGVYSEVYKGNCYGSQVAIKKFKNQSLDPEVLKQVRKEVRIMKSIRHPNLLLFLGASTKPGHFMILTELMDKSFHDVHKLKLDLLTKIRMAKEAAKGISWLHSLTPVIIHRDLKPENILIDKTGTIVKVADFGLSLVKDHSKTEAEEMRKIRGSPAFMSPEALLGEDLTAKTDVYSFGMILWELLTGGSPYEHLQIESFEELIDEICKKGTREKIPKDTPQCLKALIQSCWQPNHHDRPTFIQILHQLDECILEVAIADKEGRDMWKKDFTKDGELAITVPWDNFLIGIAAHFNLAPSLKIFTGLKALLIKEEKDNFVYIEDLGNSLKWFGPMGTHTTTNFLTRMQNVFTKRWFHGDISVETAQTRLAGHEPGTFLIRFSSNPGSYALSKIIENQRKERAIVHIRISHEPGGNYAFVLDDTVYEYDSLDELVKAAVLGLTNPCPGSYYYAQFRIKQVVSGYVNTVNMS